MSSIPNLETQVILTKPELTQNPKVRPKPIKTHQEQLEELLLKVEATKVKIAEEARKARERNLKGIYSVLSDLGLDRLDASIWKSAAAELKAVLEKHAKSKPAN